MIDRRVLLKMYRDIVLTKEFNGRFVTLKREGKVPGVIHQTEGQEAVGVGVTAALEKDDYIVDYYRGMAGWIARGIDLRKLAAELLGRAPGLCKGKGGEMSLADPSIGLLSCSGIVGGSIPLGVGVAFAAKSYGRGQVVAVFFGDGAANTGAFHEGLNMAGFLKVPAIFVCLNNQYGISTYIGDVLAGGSIAKRAAAYGMPGLEVDGNDVVAVYTAAVEAISRARKGEGPSLIEVMTYRIGGHSSTNPETDLMDQGKMAHYLSRDPLKLLHGRLIDNGVASEAELKAIVEVASKEAEDAVEFGLAAPYPEPDEAVRGMFV